MTDHDRFAELERLEEALRACGASPRCEVRGPDVVLRVEPTPGARLELQPAPGGSCAWRAWGRLPARDAVRLVEGLTGAAIPPAPHVVLRRIGCASPQSAAVAAGSG